MQKQERLEQDTKVALSNIINYEVKNPNVSGLISVTDVKITPDQKYATIYVSIFGKKSDKVLLGLKESTGFIKSALSKKVKFRIIPELTFKLDDSLNYGAKMDKMIDNVIKNDESMKKENN